MPVLKVYHHGVTAAIPPKKNDHVRAKRGSCTGWSKSATRNNIRFLRSVNPVSLGDEQEFGVAFTLTLRDCPDSSADWASLRRAFIERMRRLGMLRLHWVTEWQRRGVPHLHGIVFFPLSACPVHQGKPFHSRFLSILSSHWCAVSKPYGSNSASQHLKLITDIKGWFKYLSKHSARGADHYQRSSSGIPTGWVKVGRVWGHCGDWVIDEGVRMDVSDSFYFAFRRIVRSWRKSDARSESDSKVRAKRISSARRMLQSNTRTLSVVRGVSEWIDQEQLFLIAEFLVSQGYELLLD